MSDRPGLIIVSGAPATGKSTLARTIAEELGLPLLMKDELKEAIADEVGMPAHVPASQRLGLAAYRVLFLVGARILGAGGGLVLESNFRRGRSEPELRPLAEVADARLVHCTAARSTVQARYLERYRLGDRHPVHLDADRAEALAHDLASGRFEPLDLDVPTMVVHTDDGYAPSLEEIVGFAGGRALVGSNA
jgi:predicted kinase